MSTQMQGSIEMKELRFTTRRLIRLIIYMLMVVVACAGTIVGLTGAIGVIMQTLPYRTAPAGPWYRYWSLMFHYPIIMTAAGAYALYMAFKIEAMLSNNNDVMIGFDEIPPQSIYKCRSCSTLLGRSVMLICRKCYCIFPIGIVIPVIRLLGRCISLIYAALLIAIVLIFIIAFR